MLTVLLAAAVCGTVVIFQMAPLPRLMFTCPSAPSTFVSTVPPVMLVLVKALGDLSTSVPAPVLMSEPKTFPPLRVYLLVELVTEVALGVTPAGSTVMLMSLLVSPSVTRSVFLNLLGTEASSSQGVLLRLWSKVPVRFDGFQRRFLGSSPKTVAEKKRSSRASQSSALS